MIFDRVFVEKGVANSPHTLKILNSLKNPNHQVIDKYSDYFGKIKKPYLQKRKNLNLYLAEKKGQLVKSAPPAYGEAGEPHYYFIHAYNCIYECEYCYLQGYFSSPDIVLFVNYDAIKEQIEKVVIQSPIGSRPWFHAGEFSDSLALSHITGECEFYWRTFKELPQAQLELRTKSANLTAIKKLAPLENIIISFSMSPESQIKRFDRKTATYSQRLKSIQILSQLGHPIGIHFDPIIYTETFLTDYAQTLTDLSKHIDLKKLRYISLGVVRFTKDCFKQVKNNYPNSQLIHGEYINSFDGKVRYSRPHRSMILNQIRECCLAHGANPKSVYLCME